MLRLLKKKSKKKEIQRERCSSEMSDIEMISSLTPSLSSKSSGSSSSSSKSSSTKSSKATGDLRNRPPILRHPDAIFDQWLEERSNIPLIGDIGGQEYYKKNEEENLVRQNEATAIHNDEIEYKEQLDKKKLELVNAVQNVLEVYKNLRTKLQQSYNATSNENLKDKYLNVLADINETELFLNKTFLSETINDKNINDLIEKAKNIGIYSGDIFENRLNFLELKQKFSIPTWNKEEKLELLQNLICERGTYLSEIQEEYRPIYFSFDSKCEMSTAHSDLTPSPQQIDNSLRQEETESDENIQAVEKRLIYRTIPEYCGHVEEDTEIYDEDMSIDLQIPEKIDVLVVKAKHQKKTVRINLKRNCYQSFERENFKIPEDDGESFFRRLVNNIVSKIS